MGLFKRRWLILTGSGLLGALLLAYLASLNSKVNSLPPLPSPNGYDEFLKAGALYQSASRDYRQMDTEALRAYVSSNRPALELLRRGLQGQAQAPVDDSMESLQKRLPELATMKGLAQVLSAESRLALVEGQAGKSALIAVETIRFGHAIARGGLLIHRLIGNSIENMGLSDVEWLIDRVDAPSCRSLAQGFEEIDAADELPDAVVRRDRDWGRRVTGVRGWIQAALTERTFRPGKQAEKKFVQRTHDTIRRRRIVMLQLAARAYELEVGRKPDNAAQLVPAYLRSIPVDPESGTNLTLLTPSR